MNTPAHLLFGAAVFGKRYRPALAWAAFAGALVPDLSLYLLAGGAIFVLGIAPRRVFDELYFSDAWQTVFAIDNSVFLWGALLALALWRRSDWGLAFAGAGLLHLAFDFPLHHDDGRPHFWPLSDWVFNSPVSYWDRGHGALWIAPVETALAALAAGVIWWRRPGWPVAVATGALLAAQLYVARVWLLVFGI